MFAIEAIDLLDAALRTMRVVALVTGLLVVVDSIGVLMTYPEKPPHRPRANALAWLIAGLTAATSAGWLLIEAYAGDLNDVHADIARLLGWVGWSIAFTIRAIYRARRPWLPIVSAVLMTAFGVVLALVDAAT